MESNKEEQNVQTNNIPPKNNKTYGDKIVGFLGLTLMLLIILVMIGMVGDHVGWFKKGVSQNNNSIVDYSVGYSRVTDCVIPEGTIQIENGAFSQSKDIKFVYIPSSVKSIGERAFLSCTQLEMVIFESGSQLLNIGDYAFAECAGLKSITIPKGVQRIGSAAFEKCISLDSLNIPDSVKEIKTSTFSHCENLRSIAFPHSVTSIGDHAFDGCKNLKSVTIPNSVTNIGDYAFCDLQSVTLPSGIDKIGHGAFSSIDEIHYNGSIQEWIEESWYPCSIFMDTYDSGSGHFNSYELYIRDRLLKNVEIPNTVTYLNSFSGCSSLISVTIPNSVTSIGRYAFRNCYGLTSVTIPNSVTSIGDYAFYNCTGLISLTIPNSVTNIGENAFYFSSDLTLRVPEKFNGRVSFPGCKEVIYY